jgi:mono/diheme cytochrome c family protein
MRWFYGLLLICLASAVPRTGVAEAADYLRDVKPLLARRCVVCHGPAKQKAGLRLDTAAAMRKGGDAGAVLVPGKSADSLLIRAVTGAPDVPLMPRNGPRLTAAEVAILRAWIDQGARAPAQEVAGAATALRTTHWSFQPVVRPPLPAVQDSTWVRNPIDRFILARLEKEGIRPSPEADRATLIRRVSLDLVGLPPSVAEVDAFVTDTRPDAYERLVERLLASPHYGERWGRHWLDLARYADSNGFNIDAPRSIWKYRDWVIDALNRDVPFNEFTVEQIAGDLLPGAGPNAKVATGFHRNTLLNQEGGIDVEQFRVESIVDRVNTTGAVFLGLTVGCAQCHDHKYDPLTQREYYQLFAFFNNADEPALELPTPAQQRQRQRIRARIGELDRQQRLFDPIDEVKLDQWEKKLQLEERTKLPLDIRGILDVPDNARDATQVRALLAALRSGDQMRHVLGGLGSPFLAAAHAQALSFRIAVSREIARLRKQEPAVVTTLVMQERRQPRATHVHLGGDFLRKGARVFPGVPAALPPLSVKGPNRLDLARWLVDPKNPLTSRVTVNRVWQRSFGVGIVETENDFGTQGTPPSHPELLDWLASEFVARGWSLKALDRQIVTSATYRQSSRARPDLAVLDPRNRLLARQARLRLEAEAVRDEALAASGLLARKIGGPSVFPPQPDGVFVFTQIPRNWQANTGPDRYRRGLYTFLWRSAPHPALTVFDAPDTTTTCTRRNRSNTPLQALTLLNDQAFYELAQGLAARILREGPGDDAGRLDFAFRVCLARLPRARERTRLDALLQDQLAGFGSTADAGRQAQAWTTVARVMLNLDEFLTRE